MDVNHLAHQLRKAAAAVERLKIRRRKLITALKRNDDQYRELTRTFKLMTQAVAAEAPALTEPRQIEGYFCAKCADFHTRLSDNTEHPNYEGHKHHATTDKLGARAGA